MGIPLDSKPKTPSPHEHENKSRSPDTEPLVTRTVDTDVTQHISTAVIHETVHPRVHEVHQTKIIREIHKYHIYHRILPVLETEVLPSRHFVESSSGKGLVEVSRHEVSRLTGSPVREWVATPQSSWTNEHGDVPEDNRHVQIEKEPILMDKRTYVTEDGISRTEYLWRHPPVFEDVHGRTTPVRIPAGLSDDWKQISMKSRPGGAANERRDASHGDGDQMDNRADIGRSVANVDTTSSVYNTKSTGARSPSKIPHRAPAKPTATPEHGGLAIRTVSREGTGQNGEGSPNLLRKGSLQNLRDARAASNSPQDGEANAQLRRESEGQTRKFFLNEGGSNNIGKAL